MSESPSETAARKLSSKIDAVMLGLKWLYALALLILSIPNLVFALSIHSFDQLFHDALPGKPLPTLTNFIIHDSTFLIILTFVLPLTGIMTVCLGKKPPVWMIVASLVLGIISLQILATGFGLFIPLIADLVGTPGAISG